MPLTLPASVLVPMETVAENDAGLATTRGCVESYSSPTMGDCAPPLAVADVQRTSAIRNRLECQAPSAREASAAAPNPRSVASLPSPAAERHRVQPPTC